MEFCRDCGYHLTPETARGELIFRCENCKTPHESTPEHTLRSEINFEAAESSQKYEVSEENAPFDTAGKLVDIECKKCGMPYMTQIYVGVNYVSKYVCRCGNKIDYSTG